MINPTSRYYGIATAELTTAEGRILVYLRRRFLPVTAPALELAQHSVAEGDRLDNITARYLGDPEQFWRIADANQAMDPQELTSEIGRRLRIPLPEGG